MVLSLRVPALNAAEMGVIIVFRFAVEKGLLLWWKVDQVRVCGEVCTPFGHTTKGTPVCQNEVRTVFCRYPPRSQHTPHA